MEITKTCGCGYTQTATITIEQMLAVSDRSELIQNILPDWSANDREFFFLSGLCNECWDAMTEYMSYCAYPYED